MEPMTLGSPPTTPTPTNPNFLPAFLMGTSRRTPSATIQSPDRSGYISSLSQTNTQQYLNSVPAEMHLSSIQSPSAIQSPSMLQSPNALHSTSSLHASTSYQPLNTLTSPNSNITSQSPPGDVSFNRTSGPPKVGLFDTLEVKSSVHTPTFNSNRKQSLHSMNEDPSSISFAPYATNKSLHGSDSFNNVSVINGEMNSSLWVTVFGFPTSALSLVMARLANCGTITERITPTQGNWLYIKFSTPYEAAKALSLNGKLVTNSIMIGVAPYQNKQENKENAVNSTTPYMTPVRARPLRQSLASPQCNNSFINQQNTPQKSTGFVSKALDYVLGW